jgi:hypothetical protein
MKRLSVKTTDCSCDKLIKIAEKCGFTVVNGSRHCRVINQKGEPISTIPRHSNLNKYTVKGILEAFNELGEADIETIN